MRLPDKGSLGKPFYEWLAFCEELERFAHGAKIQRPHIRVCEDFFGVKAGDERELYGSILKVSAELAQPLRSAVKYKATTGTLLGLTKNYEDELEYLMYNQPLRLPHDPCVLMVDEDDGSTFGFCLARESATNDYPELGLRRGEEFICANIAYRAENSDGSITTNMIPVEIHWVEGETLENTKQVYATPTELIVHDAGQKAMEYATQMMNVWLLSFGLAHMKRQRQPGIPAQHLMSKPKKLKKRRHFPLFEHFVMTLDIAPDGSCHTGRSVFQPRKRLHQVRGFYRHYKSGKVAWVKPHWRGDESLGVVRTDFEMVNK